MKMKGQTHSSAAIHGKSSHHHNNNYNNNNNTTSSAHLKEAERRLGVILKTAKKMSFTTDDISALEAVKKLTQGYRRRCKSWLQHILPILAGLFAMLMVYLLVYSMDHQGFGCLQNTSETVVVRKESVPVMTAPRRVPEEPRASGRNEESRSGADQGTGTAERWVASTNGRSMRNER